jgi:hypothetical protein
MSVAPIPGEGAAASLELRTGALRSGSDAAERLKCDDAPPPSCRLGPREGTPTMDVRSASSRQRRRRPAYGPAYHGQASVDAMALVALLSMGGGRSNSASWAIYPAI